MRSVKNGRDTEQEKVLDQGYLEKPTLLTVRLLSIKFDAMTSRHIQIKCSNQTKGHFVS